MAECSAAKINEFVSALQKQLESLPEYIDTCDALTAKLSKEIHDIYNRFIILKAEIVYWLRTTYCDKIENDAPAFDEYKDIVDQLDRILSDHTTFITNIRFDAQSTATKLYSDNPTFGQLTDYYVTTVKCATYTHFNMHIAEIRKGYRLAIFFFKRAEKNLFAENSDRHMHM
jgi:hypothetical protein